jgi:hypothetical protein
LRRWGELTPVIAGLGKVILFKFMMTVLKALVKQCQQIHLPIHTYTWFVNVDKVLL